MTQKRYELIVFDWDGTLMDSTAHIVSCMRVAIEALGLPPLADSTISHIIGLGLPEAVKTLYPSQPASTLQALADGYRQAWVTRPEDTRLFDNAQTLLKELSEQDYFLAVATGKSRRGLNRSFNDTGLGDYFHTSRCADECHSKPHPQMLMEIMDYLGVSAEQTLMIGDTEFDLLMAQNARADSLGIAHGAHDTEQLSACEPQAIVEDLYQLQQWLNRNTA